MPGAPVKGIVLIETWAIVTIYFDYSKACVHGFHSSSHAAGSSARHHNRPPSASDMVSRGGRTLKGGTARWWVDDTLLFLVYPCWEDTLTNVQPSLQPVRRVMLRNASLHQQRNQAFSRTSAGQVSPIDFLAALQRIAVSGWCIHSMRDFAKDLGQRQKIDSFLRLWPRGRMWCPTMARKSNGLPLVEPSVPVQEIKRRNDGVGCCSQH